MYVRLHFGWCAEGFSENQFWNYRSALDLQVIHNVYIKSSILTACLRMSVKIK